MSQPHVFLPDPKNKIRCTLCGFTEASDRHDYRWICQVCEYPRTAHNGWCGNCRAYTGQRYKDGHPVCDCGNKLLGHYPSDLMHLSVQDLVKRLGVVQRIEVLGLRPVWVPRHYVALHGVVGNRLPGLAARYKWRTEVDK